MSSSYLNRYRSKLVGILAAILVVCAVPIIKRIASANPWAGLEDANYLDPFGPGIGSVMSDVDIVAYDKARQVASFNVRRAELRRDQQFIRLIDVRRGVVYKGDKACARFLASLVNYDAKRGIAQVNGTAQLTNQEFNLKTTNLIVDRMKESIATQSPITGTYRNGIVRAASFTLEYARRHATLEKLDWTGPASDLTQDKSQKKRINVRSRQMETFTDPDREVYLDAELTEEDSMMRAEKMTWNKQTDVVTAEGNVEYYGPDAVITGPVITIYRKEKRAVATGQIRIFVKPEKDKGKPTEAPPIPPAKPILPEGLKQPAQTQDEQNKKEQEVRDPKTARKYPILITCSKVEYYYEKGAKKAVITGSPKAHQDLASGAWREVTAPMAVYEEEKEILTLLSVNQGKDVRMKNSNGDDFLAETVIISTVQGKEKVTASHLEGSMTVKEEQTEPPPSGAPKRTGGG